MLTSLRRFLRAPAATLRGSDYKGTWNEAAAHDAEDAILTGATAEEFERTGRGDADMVARFAKPGDAVLDIGCGIGRVEKYLAPRVREMWAVDVSGEMIARAERRLEGLPNVRLREVGNSEFLSSFEPERFDLVFSFLVLQHLAREDAFLYLRDAFRVLRPGGILLTQFPNLLSTAYTKAFVSQADVSPRSPGRVRIYTEAEVRHLLGMAGYEIFELWFGGHGEPAEIYVAARKAARARVAGQEGASPADSRQAPVRG